MTIRDMALNSLRADGFFGFGFPNTQFPGATRPGVSNQPPEPQVNAAIRTAGSAMGEAIGVINGQNAGELQGFTSDAEVATV